MWLLRLVSSYVWLSDSEQLDARRPAAEQLRTFERLGFTSVPTAGQLLRFMVATAEGRSQRAHRLYQNELQPFSMQDYYVKGERWIRPAPAQHADHVHEPTTWWEAADESGLRDAEAQDAIL